MESKGHSERGKERGRDWRAAANAFCRNWLPNVPVIGAIWEVGSFHLSSPPVFLLLPPPPPLILLFFPSPLSPLPRPLTSTGNMLARFFQILPPSFSEAKSKRNHRKGMVTLNESAKQLCPWRKALIIPIKMLSQHSSKWGQKSQDQRQWRNTGGDFMITACEIFHMGSTFKLSQCVAYIDNSLYSCSRHPHTLGNEPGL